MSHAASKYQIESGTFFIISCAVVLFLYLVAVSVVQFDTAAVWCMNCWDSSHGVIVTLTSGWRWMFVFSAVRYGAEQHSLTHTLTHSDTHSTGLLFPSLLRLQKHPPPTPPRQWMSYCWCSVWAWCAPPWLDRTPLVGCLQTDVAASRRAALRHQVALLSKCARSPPLCSCLRLMHTHTHTHTCTADAPLRF